MTKIALAYDVGGRGDKSFNDMMKRVDVGVYKAVEMAVKGPFTGELLSLGIKEGGIGVSDLAALDDLLNDPVSKEGIEKDME